MIRFPWLLSLVVGFLSLSQEILWVRLVSFNYRGIPHAFSLVLANYLIGIALGANLGKYFCKKDDQLYAIAAITLFVAGVTDILTPVLAPHILGQAYSTLPIVALTIVLTAGLKSILFPIAHHLGSNQQGPNIGSSVSKIYFGNIIGSTLGPIVTGFILLDHFTVEQCFSIVGSVTLLMGILTAFYTQSKQVCVTVFGLVITAFFLLKPWQSTDAIRQLAIRWPDKSQPVIDIIQNKHGIIHTVKGDEKGDTVFGTNIYDGRINVDMNVNSNWLDRAYVLAAMHPHPKRILVVGMSSGAWTRVLQGFPSVELIDVVEINPGYIELIKKYPNISPILNDPRIKIHIDDGRRWLKRHPQEKYDLIVQNTSYHWRAYATNILSQEYAQEVGQHLLPNGIMAVNTTFSLDVFYTLKQVYPYVLKYGNFAYVSHQPIVIEREQAVDRLKQCKLDDQPALPEGFETHDWGAKIPYSLQPIEQLLNKPHKVWPEVITDENMVSEYRHGLYINLPILSSLYPDNPNAYDTHNDLR